MGVDYYSYLVVGCSIDDSKFEIPTKVRACECVVDGIEDMKFCSSCGKEVWKEDYDFVDGYEEKESFLGLPLVYDTDYNNCWIAIRKKAVGGYNNDEFDTLDRYDNIEELKKELKEKLEPHGLWDEESFGIWVIQQCSY
jgi:hypothetical protein